MPWAASEGRRIALVAGEAGSGKSRLVREFAHEAAAGGALVLYGACDAVVPTPYGPFAEALDRLARTRRSGPPPRRPRAGRRRAPAAAAGPRRPGRRPPRSRHGRPGHGAPPAPHGGRRAPDRDRPAYAGPARPRGRALGRPSDAPAPAPPRAGRRRRPPARRRDVPRHRGRPAAGARRRAGRPAPERAGHAECGSRASRPTTSRTSSARPAEAASTGLPALAESIFELTGGNAFLLTELWRELVEAGAARPGADLAGSLAGLDTPEGVRDVVNQRLARLEPGTRAVLELAAVAGPEFETDVIREAGHLDAAALAAALDEAVASGMIEEVPGHTLAHRFAHELVRRALYDRLAAGRRAELHLRIAEALDERASDGSARALGDVAHHFAAAAPIGGTDRAVEYSLLAAAAAMVALAFDEAAVALRTALELGIPGGTRPRRRAPRSRRGDLPGRPLRRVAGCVPGGGGHRARPGRRPPPVAGCGRLRGRLLADGHRLRRRARAARGGGRGARGGRLAAARARARRARPGAGVRRPTRGERAGARRGDRHGPPGRRPPGPCADAEPLLLAARADALPRHPRHAGRGARHRPAAGRHRDRRRGDPVADRVAHRDRRPDRRPGGAGRAARHGRTYAPAVRDARGRAVRRGDRALRRAPARGGGGGRAVAGVEPAA